MPATLEGSRLGGKGKTGGSGKRDYDIRGRVLESHSASEPVNSGGVYGPTGAASVSIGEYAEDVAVIGGGE